MIHDVYFQSRGYICFAKKKKKVCSELQKRLNKSAVFVLISLVHSLSQLVAYVKIWDILL